MQSWFDTLLSPPFLTLLASLLPCSNSGHTGGLALPPLFPLASPLPRGQTAAAHVIGEVILLLCLLNCHFFSSLPPQPFRFAAFTVSLPLLSLSLLTAFTSLTECAAGYESSPPRSHGVPS